MSGQGRPSFWAKAAPSTFFHANGEPRVSAQFLRGAIAPGAFAFWLVLATAFLSCTAVAQETSTRQLVRLRVEWGGNSELPTRWTGRIAIRGGTLADVTVLDRTSDALASISLYQDEVHIHSVERRVGQSIEIAMFAGDEAKLAVELEAEHMSVPFKTELAIAQISRQATTTPINDRGQVLTVLRPPSDVLRLETNHAVMVFSPGEIFSLTLSPILPELQPGSTFDVSTSLTSSRDGHLVWRDQQRLPVPVDSPPMAQVSIPLPAEEGCYTVRVSVAHPPGLTERFFPVGAKHDSLAERLFQIVVLKLSAESNPAEGRWETILTIDPANPRWWQRLPKWTNLGGRPRLVTGPLGSVRAGTVDYPFGRFVDLPGKTPGGEAHWQAYPLPIEQVGRAHLLELDYPANDEQHLGLSILEPDAAPEAAPIGPSSGVYVEGFGLRENADRHTHRIAFWPRTNSPLLLVSNIHPSASAQFGAIRVLRREGPLAPSGTQPAWQNAERIVAAYFSEPRMAKAFGAKASAEGAARRGAEWQSIFDGAQRLVDYLPFAGFNGAVIGELEPGGTSASRRLVAVPDEKSILPLRDDLPEVDALELYLRVFDRQGLALVPSVNFKMPIARLERLRGSMNPQSSGIEWVNGDGRTWLEANGTRDGDAPYYNLLNERVQQELLAHARELLEKYGHHPALAGLAVQLSGVGFAQLPGLEWGFDDTTWQAFARETGVSVSDRGPNRFAIRLGAATGEHAMEWRAWRAARVTAFYAQLANLVFASHPKRRLLIATNDMFDTPELAALVRPRIQSNLGLDQAMLSVGIDRQAFAKIPGAMLTETQYIEPAVPLVDRAMHTYLNDITNGSRRSDARENVAPLFFHPLQEVASNGFAAQSGCPAYSQIAFASSADGAAGRRPYARDLANGAATWILEGGESLALGQEDAMRNVRRLVQSLPPDRTSTKISRQPVTIRTFNESSSTICVVVNDSPWKVDVAAQLDMPRTAKMKLLEVCDASGKENALQPQAFEAGTKSWEFELAPYGVCGVQFDSPGVVVRDIRAATSAVAKAELESRVKELDGRDLTAASLYPVLTNPGFETASEGAKIVGWELVGSSDQATIELDLNEPRAGRGSLHWHSRGGSSVVQSNEFTMPPTGQLFLSAFIRGKNLGPATELRMVLEGEQDGRPYRQFALIGGKAAGSQPFMKDWGRPYGFGVNNIPLDSSGKMRVKFELTGTGEIWIDEVQLQDLLFPLTYYRFYEQERLEFVKIKNAARSAVADNRISDGVALLESYWPRFMLEYTTATAAPVVNAPPSTTPETSAETENDDETANVSGLRKYLPTWLR